MARPKIEIPATGVSKVLELLTLLSVLLTIGFIAFYFSSLPEMIPIYFNWPSKVDGFATKNILWTCPLFSVIIGLTIHKLSRTPWILNYPVSITRKNAETNYKLASGMLQIMSLLISIAFLCLSLMSIYAGLGKPLGWENHFFVLFSILMVLIPAGYVILSHYKLKEDKIK